MATMGSLVAIFGFCAFFALAPAVVEPGRSRLVGSRAAAICGTLASLAIMAIGTHV